MSTFIEKLTSAIARNNSLLCVGLDPTPEKEPEHFPNFETDPAKALLTWGQNIIEQTKDLVCCYKPNFAFYEQYGLAGLEAMRQTIATVPADVPVLLDAKRGDIGHTAAAYAKAAFEVWGADAITISPYLGRDSVAPFLEFPGKAVFVLCYTSNPSAQEIQEFTSHGDEQLFEHVARAAQTWGTPDEVGFVVGATQPLALTKVRVIAPNSWILAPGVGAQGGDLEQAIEAGLNGHGDGMIVPVSRSIIYADNPRAVAQTLRDEINQARQAFFAPDEGDTTRQTALIQLLHEVGCVQFGEFTLASGKQSPIYIDLRRVTASPSLLRMVAHAYVGLLCLLSFDHLAAVPYAALPIGAAISLAINKPLIYPRKEVKAYGTGRSIEGRYDSGDKVVVIEDLVTSGGSVVKAIEQLEAAELIVQDVAVLIDREQGGRETLAEKGYRLHAALTLPQILDVLHQTNRISTIEFEKVKRYLEN